MMTFQIKKRINTELFNGRTVDLYIREIQIRVVTNNRDPHVGSLAD